MALHRNELEIRTLLVGMKTLLSVYLSMREVWDGGIRGLESIVASLGD